MWKRHCRRIGGYVCVAAGIAGILLPILPGIPFLLAGVTLLGRDARLSRWVARTARLWRDKATGGANRPDVARSRPGIPGGSLCAWHNVKIDFDLVLNSHCSPRRANGFDSEIRLP